MPVIIRGLSGLSKKIKDATATPADIIGGKVAYGNDHTRMVGTHVCKKMSTVLNLEAKEIIAIADKNLKHENVHRLGFVCLENDTFPEQIMDYFPTYANGELVSMFWHFPRTNYSGSFCILKKIEVNIPYNSNTVIEITRASVTKKMNYLGYENINSGLYGCYIGSSSNPMNVMYSSNIANESYAKLMLVMRILNGIITEIGFAADISGSNITVKNYNAFGVSIKPSWI